MRVICLVLAAAMLVGMGVGGVVRGGGAEGAVVTLGVEGALDRIDAEVVVDVPLDAAWRAWTTDEGVRSFFAPDSRVELRIGGAFELYFAPNAPEGERGSDGCRVLSYLPGEMVSFSWNAPPYFERARGARHTWVVMRFEEAEGGVRVRLSHLGFAESVEGEEGLEEEMARVRAYFARVWPHVLESMKARLEEE